VTERTSPGRRLALSACALAVAGALTAGALYASQEEASAQPAGASMKVLARGLDNPRGLDIGPDGAVYVAEAGKGGPNCEGSGQDQICTGNTGAVTRISEKGRQKSFAGPLPSVADPSGFAASGPHDVAFARVKTRSGNTVLYNPYVVVGEAPEMGTSGKFSSLRQVKGGKNGGSTRVIADLLAYERRNNSDDAIDPFTGDPELASNPYSVVAKEGRAVVADAAANALVQVRPGGRVSTLAVFPTRPVENPGQFGLPPGFRYQSVPDAVAVARNGDYFVGELTGFPFPVGKARVYRVDEDGGRPRVYARGFTSIIDVAAGPDGSVYVLEIARKGLLQAEGPNGDFTGRLTRIFPGGRKEVVASNGLVAPGGVAVARDGTLYVSNFSIFPGQGQLLRIKQ